MANSIVTEIRGTADGIVSKKLTGGSGGNVSLFAFDKGQIIEKHSTPNKALVVGLEGEAIFEKGTEKIELKKDSFVLLEENEVHALEAITSFKMLLVILKA